MGIIAPWFKRIVRNMRAERSFVILKCVNKVPTLAGCTKCLRKFFAPTTYKGDAVGAEEYLRDKFDLHKCEEGQRRRRW